MPTITDQRTNAKGKEGIQWTDFTCNPFKLELPDGKRVNACVKISPGCRRCYAESLTQRWWNTETRGAFPGFSLPLLQRGTPWLDVELLRKILRWRPRPPFKAPDGRPKCFAFDMTDFFFALWPDEFLDQFMAVVAIRTDIDFQILTKRAERMHRYITNWLRRQDGAESPTGTVKPLPNLWLGVSVENQEYADERIPILLGTPAAVRFVSYEPAIGPVDFAYSVHQRRIGDPQPDWIIVGGESGYAASEFDLAWADATIRQCKMAGVACFIKQLGQCPIFHTHADQKVRLTSLRDSHGGIMAEWPDDLRVRQWPRSKR